MIRWLIRFWKHAYFVVGFGLMNWHGVVLPLFDIRLEYRDDK